METKVWQIVSSSMINSIGYDYLLKELYIEFKNSKIYSYSEVSHRTYNLLMEAESIGKYFNKYIKNDYKCNLLY